MLSTFTLFYGLLGLAHASRFEKRNQTNGAASPVRVGLIDERIGQVGNHEASLREQRTHIDASAEVAQDRRVLLRLHHEGR